MEPNILEMNHITKIYPNGFVANDNVTLTAKKGEIHALIGENGAGKTTLMKVLFGIEKPDKGEIIFNGEKVEIKNPADAIALGIGMVHQHFMLASSLSVAENIVLGLDNGFKRFDLKKAIEKTKSMAKKYGIEIDPEEKVQNLSVGNKQRVEILKALTRGAKVLILDEPTAVLTPQESEDLFVQLKQIKEQGHTIIFISHKLKEITSFCDRLTVLKMGRSLGEMDVGCMSEREISHLMVGREVLLNYEKPISIPKEKVLEIKNLTYIRNGKKVINDVSFSVHGGEILGIAGVEGNGQRELAELVSGLLKNYEGTILVSGNDISRDTVRMIRETGVSHIPEDRMTYGVVKNASIMENIIADRYYKKPFIKNALLDIPKLRSLANNLVAEYTVKCDDIDQEIRMLSGGNMQKVVVARELSSSPKLIIANQPTRGVDVGASEIIRNSLINMRTNGAGVLLVSADLNEVLDVSDRLIVMYGGEIVASFPSAKAVDEHELGEFMLGIKKQNMKEGQA